ncbi:MAG TPA: helix-turn-helix transcriptional regulator [Paludibacter sp.]|nr:helix-turn-helix transcriptional regulator [Paludibacter sp.]
MDEKERIERIMQKEEMTAAVFAAEIGIQGSTLSHILNGRNNPSLDVLKKILKRFKTINPDWLILGDGAIYRTEKHSQAPTLFDEIDESSSKSVTSMLESEKKSEPPFSMNQERKQPVPEAPAKPVIETIQNTSVTPEQPPKTVQRIIIYYSDNTFQEFEGK